MLLTSIVSLLRSDGLSQNSRRNEKLRANLMLKPGRRENGEVWLEVGWGGLVWTGVDWCDFHTGPHRATPTKRPGGPVWLGVARCGKQIQCHVVRLRNL
eukprot:scaffold3410_cov185-Ochromonas_danica.AAC.1